MLVVNCAELYEANDLAYEFATSLYSALNRYAVYNPGTHLRMDNFWQECNIKLVSEMGCPTTKFENNAVVVVTRKLICNTKMYHNLFFYPNVAYNGAHGDVDKYGVFTVLAHGTLHQQNKVSGAFEQMFNLTSDPFDGNKWKIMRTHLHIMPKNYIV
jgi:hypothetical protein